MDAALHPFDHRSPTRVVFGAGAARQVGTCARWYGRRALLVAGAGSARSSGLLDQVQSMLDAAGMRTELFEGVSGNPSASIVDAGAALALSRMSEVVIGVGGGSVLDTAKAIAVAAEMNRPGLPDALGDYRQLLSGISKRPFAITGALPVIAVPTLPGSGSETNGTSVIVDDRTGRKLSSHSDRAIPRVALVDPTWSSRAPARLLAAGIADTLAHAIESTLSARSNVAAELAADAAARAVLEHGRAAVAGELPAVARCLWASELAGQALSLAGSIVTHPLAHPLSAWGGGHHGETVAALQPAVLEVLGERFARRMSLLGPWFGSRAKTAEGVQRAVVAGLRTWQQELGVVTDPAAIGLAADQIERYVEDVLASGSRGLANTPGPPLVAADLADVYTALASAD